jgi:transcriptional regulator with XRE-family HTH domain
LNISIREKRKMLREKKVQEKQLMHIAGRNIRYICKEKSITYDELAEGVGSTRKDLEKLTYGQNYSEELLGLIANFLEVTEEELTDKDFIRNRREKIYLVSNIRILRMLKSMDYADIASKAGINIKTLYQIANGNYSFSSEKLELIAKAFDITKQELLYHDFSEGREEQAGNNLRALRKARGISIYELSEKSGISVYRIEKTEYTGEIRRPKDFEKLANALEVSCEELLFGDFQKKL